MAAKAKYPELLRIRCIVSRWLGREVSSDHIDMLLEAGLYVTALNCNNELLSDSPKNKLFSGDDRNQEHYLGLIKASVDSGFSSMVLEKCSVVFYLLTDDNDTESSYRNNLKKELIDNTIIESDCGYQFVLREFIFSYLSSSRCEV